MAKNLTAAPFTITKGVRITWVIAVNAIQQVGVSPGMLENLNEVLGVWRVKMWVEQRREALFQQLDLSSLEEWSTKSWLALIWKRCWKWVQFTQATAHGAMLLCWYTRRTEVYASALITINWIQEQRRTPIHSCGYKNWLRAWLVQGTFPAWT